MVVELERPETSKPGQDILELLILVAEVEAETRTVEVRVDRGSLSCVIRPVTISMLALVSQQKPE
jgi:hypothetical protein